MNSTTKKIVMASMLSALCCVATMLIKIPSPLKGYMNLGDCIVLLAGFMLSPVYGFLTAGIGSALADVFSGYIIYAPATFVIKGIMAIIVHYGVRAMKNKPGGLPAKIISGALAEIEMIAGYYIFEGFMYGFIPSLVNMPANLAQGVTGLVFGIVLVKLFEKHRIMD